MPRACVGGSESIASSSASRVSASRSISSGERLKSTSSDGIGSAASSPSSGTGTSRFCSRRRSIERCRRRGTARSRAASGLELPGVGDQLHERLLHDVLGRRGIAQQAQGKAVQAVGPQVEERAEAARVAPLDGLDAGHLVEGARRSRRHARAAHPFITARPRASLAHGLPRRSARARAPQAGLTSAVRRESAGSSRAARARSRSRGRPARARTCARSSAG